LLLLRGVKKYIKGYWQRAGLPPLEHIAVASAQVASGLLSLKLVALLALPLQALTCPTHPKRQYISLPVDPGSGIRAEQLPFPIVLHHFLMRYARGLELRPLDHISA
jgi:hypothetical protein